MVTVIGERMKINSTLNPVVLIGVLCTALVTWFYLKADIVKTGFFIGKNIGKINTSCFDESIQATVEKAGFNYSIEQAEPLSDDEINKLFK